MPSGLSYPTTQANEPGSILVPGESFSPFMIYDCGCEAPSLPSQTQITVEPPAVSTLLAPAQAPSNGIDWVVVLIVAGIFLIALGGNQ